MNFKVLLLASLITLTFTACERDSIDEIPQEDISTEFFEMDYGDLTVTDPEIIDLVKGLNIDAGTIKTKIMNFPDGTSEERFIIGGDLAFTGEQLQIMKDGPAPTPIGEEGIISQYRTNDLVTGASRTIDILGFTGDGQGLSGLGRRGLRMAVANYNRLRGVSLNFRLTFGSSQAEIDAADMVVFDDSINESGSGGVAGFPDASGRPNKFAAIFNLNGFSVDVNEHVITHEIGHSIGFRHTDFFNRVSCGGAPVDEGDGGVGAIHISRTPTGNDATSLMNACFSSTVNGEFNANDRRALRRIY